MGRRVVEAAFDGGDIVSDGGVMPLRQVDRRLGLTQAAATVVNDARRCASVKHGLRDLLAQRIYALYCDWQDLTDHTTRCAATRCFKRRWVESMNWPPDPR